MADNYLERKMEDYRAGKLARKTRLVRTASAHGENELALEFPRLNVVVFGGCLPLLEEVVSRFRSVGCSVAVCHSDSRRCVALAQKSGSRYYPFDPSDPADRDKVVDDVTCRWGAIDVVIDLRAVHDDMPPEGVAGTALLMLIHSHPRFAMIAGCMKISGEVDWR